VTERVPPATQSHGDSVGPVVTEREVESRAGRVVHRHRADVEEAGAWSGRHGQVAGHGRRIGRYGATADLERPSQVRAEGTARPVPLRVSRRRVGVSGM